MLSWVHMIWQGAGGRTQNSLTPIQEEGQRAGVLCRQLVGLRAGGLGQGHVGMYRMATVRELTPLPPELYAVACFVPIWG